MRGNFPLLSFNRGIISQEALARVDLDHTRLSAETMTNWLPSTQGSMRIRPGTKYKGATYGDTGARLLEFVAATDDTALLELTNQKMRIWIDDELLGRPLVTTTVDLTDTGWEDNSTGGAAQASSFNIIPTMFDYTTFGVTISASSENASPPGIQRAWKAADGNTNTEWADTGPNGSTLPSWWNVDFGGSPKTVLSYSVRASNTSASLDNAPNTWRLLGSDYDTGTFATDTGKWALEDSRSAETGWALSERRLYTLTDTGTADSWRHWRLYVTAVDGDTELIIAEVEMFQTAASSQVQFSQQKLILNATAIGSVARAQKRILVTDTGIEHSLGIDVERGPVTFRVGSTQGDDDYITETSLGTGYHNLAFTPESEFHITIQNNTDINRIVRMLNIGDSGTVEMTTPWTASNLADVRYDQSADVVYVDCNGVAPRKIERRGTGRSWSVVKYEPTDGPFLSFASSDARINVSQRYGNTTMKSDIPLFKPGHVGTLWRAFNSGQSGTWYLGAKEAVTDAVSVTGISDTGKPRTENSERRIRFAVSGAYSGTVTIERSVDGEDLGFYQSKEESSGTSDTGTFTTTITDEDDNLQVWYRARMSAWSSGTALVTITYESGGVTGIARVTGYNSNTNVDIEVLSRFSDTGSTDNWQEGAWSGVQGYPQVPALHEGRLAHAGYANIWLSASDDYESFFDELEGNAAPIARTLGSGPVDSIYYLVSLIRLVAGTAGSEIAIRSSSYDEVLTRENSSAKAFSTQGSANIRALKIDSNAIFVQRSNKKLYNIGFGSAPDISGDYKSSEMTYFVPDLLEPGVVSIAVQRQPDTRVHCVLADGTVGILTYEPQEQVLCWNLWETDTGTAGMVEEAAVLPGTVEDQVYYVVKRTINGLERRFIEKWATEAESIGDTGLSWIADCAISYTDTGRTATITGAAHLGNEDVIVWADDTGQANAGKDLSYDTGAIQKSYEVTGSLVPLLSSYTDTGTGITVSANKEDSNEPAWRAFNGDPNEWWSGSSASDSGWLQVDFGAGVTKTVGSFMIQAGPQAQDPGASPVVFSLQGSSDASSWTTEVAVTDSGWTPAERRYYTDTGWTDTGANAYRYWRLLISSTQQGDNPEIGELILFPDEHFGGDITLGEAVHHAVAGLPFAATFRSSKLAYAAQFGTALNQMKRVDKIGLILYQTHNNALTFGNDTGRKMDPMPRKIDGGGTVDKDKIFETFDKLAMPFPGLWNTDSRICIKAKAPRPATVLAAVSTVNTQERV